MTLNIHVENHPTVPARVPHAPVPKEISAACVRRNGDEYESQYMQQLRRRL